MTLLTPEQIADIARRHRDRETDYGPGMARPGPLDTDIENLLRDREAIAERLEVMSADLRHVANQHKNDALLGAAASIDTLLSAIRGTKDE